MMDLKKTRNHNHSLSSTKSLDNSQRLRTYKNKMAMNKSGSSHQLNRSQQQIIKSKRKVNVSMVSDKKAMVKSRSVQRLGTPKRSTNISSLKNLKVFKEDLPRDNRDLEKPTSIHEQSADYILEPGSHNLQQSRPKFSNRLQTPKNVFKIESQQTDLASAKGGLGLQAHGSVAQSHRNIGMNIHGQLQHQASVSQIPTKTIKKLKPQSKADVSSSFLKKKKKSKVRKPSEDFEKIHNISQIDENLISKLQSAINQDSETRQK